MRISAYVHAHRIGPGETGVGKHIHNIVTRLANRSGVDLRVLATADNWRTLQERAPDHPVLSLPHDLIGVKRFAIEKSWSIFNAPSAERWIDGDADWVYSPAEAYLPTKRARAALTVHCMNWFDPDLPWYPQMSRARLAWRVRLWRAYLKQDLLVLTVSHFLRKRMSELFELDPNRIAVVGNGVEQTYFDSGALPTEPFATDPPYLLVIGGLTQRKGAPDVIRLANLLRDRKSPVQIWVAGGSEPEYAAATADHPAVRHIGYKGVDSGLPELIRGAVAVLFLSRYETFGIPAAEGMAGGAPVIVSQYAALPEVVGDGGIVVAVEDSAAVLDHVDRLMTDQEYRRGWIERGRARALASHTWDGCVDRLLNALGTFQAGGFSPRSPRQNQDAKALQTTIRG
jgi:glycosyltransferase involved in cell wall biosynthesis